MSTSQGYFLALSHNVLRRSLHFLALSQHISLLSLQRAKAQPSRTGVRLLLSARASSCYPPFPETHSILVSRDTIQTLHCNLRDSHLGYLFTNDRDPLAGFFLVRTFPPVLSSIFPSFLPFFLFGLLFLYFVVFYMIS